jgi:hypothetical protein
LELALQIAVFDTRTKSQRFIQNIKVLAPIAVIVYLAKHGSNNGNAWALSLALGLCIFPSIGEVGAVFLVAAHRSVWDKRVKFEKVKGGHL